MQALFENYSFLEVQVICSAVEKTTTGNVELDQYMTSQAMKLFENGNDTTERLFAALQNEKARLTDSIMTRPSF